MSETMIIRCACGGTELAVTGPPVAHLFCHCDDCRTMHCGAYSPEAVYPASSVAVTRGSPSAWTLKRNPRTWCASCGVRLFVDVLGRGLRGVNGILLPEGAFRPSFHMHCRFAVAAVADGLPHYSSLPPMFGGTEEVVAW